VVPPPLLPPHSLPPASLPFDFFSFTPASWDSLVDFSPRPSPTTSPRPRSHRRSPLSQLFSFPELCTSRMVFHSRTPPFSEILVSPSLCLFLRSFSPSLLLFVRFPPSVHTQYGPSPPAAWMGLVWAGDFFAFALTLSEFSLIPFFLILHLEGIEFRH